MVKFYIGKGNNKAKKADPIVDNFDDWSPDTDVGTPVGWITSGGPVGGITRHTTNAFNLPYCLRATATYDGDSSYYPRTWTKNPVTLTTHNRLKIRKAKNSGGSGGLFSDQVIKLNGVDLSAPLVLSTKDTGIAGPNGSNWFEYVIDLTAYKNSTLTLSIIVSSTSGSVWPYFDAFEFYQE